MARVTVEDCIQVIPNRYELVLVAAQRARDIGAGSPITVDRDNDKNPVVALREVAGQSINLEQVRTHIISGVNRQADLNSEDEALLALAGTGADEATNATAVAIDEVVFDGTATLAAAEEDMGDEFAGEVEAGDDVDFTTTPEITEETPA
ncbi:MAG: DNA-directed RNA polymerase subunit omega [Proteobacteria bacterium]|nr:DNA-directed RNA polymerase subunit omega [Pseudomonadota bacterium]NBX85724.1 DNA-directed RNA polymerase subunit omega [Pseudomonadota bacterium]